MAFWLVNFTFAQRFVGFFFSSSCSVITSQKTPFPLTDATASRIPNRLDLCLK